ncbi:hypothetical protein XELAEV_18011219mg, partial [Xenopus laevis]
PHCVAPSHLFSSRRRPSLLCQTEVPHRLRLIITEFVWRKWPRQPRDLAPPPSASTLSEAPSVPYYKQNLFRGYLDSGISEVRSDRDRFVINLDVKHFSPEDLSVKLDDDFVEIHGKHNERQDDHGYISREFHRRYRLPSNMDENSVSCSLSADGILTFSAPKLQPHKDSSPSDRTIPVSREEKSGSSS